MEGLRKDIQIIRESQIRMESDIKHHIRRTDLLEEILEKKVDPMYRVYLGLQWTIIVSSSAAGIVITILKLMGKV